MGDNVTVLVVDDEQSLADGRAAQLSEYYRTRTAYDGRSALVELDDDVDVVVLDRRLPGASGGEVLEEIRDRGHDCQVVMLTGVEPGADAVDMGYDEYLVKPVDTEALRETVERLLERTPRNGDLEDAVLDALGDPKTRHCCRVLANGRYSASELAEETEYSLTTVYRRLNALRQADLLTSRLEIDPDGDHYETFSVAPTRIEIEIAAEDSVAVDRYEQGPA